MCTLESATGKEDTDSAVEIKDPEKIRPTLLRVTSVTDHPEVFSEMGEMEKSFCYNKMDKLMGLLALMLPVEKQVWLSVLFVCAVHTVRPHSSTPQISSSLAFRSSFCLSKSAIVLLYTILLLPHTYVQFSLFICNFIQTICVYSMCAGLGSGCS